MKKLIFILFLIPILANSQSIWTTVSVRAIAKSNDYFLVKNTDNANSEKMSLTTLTSIADSTREAKDDSIYFNCGLTTLGKYDTEATSNFMKAADFATMSYQPDIHNATLLLDSVINDIDQFAAGSGTDAVIQKGVLDTASGNYSLATGYKTEAQGIASSTSGMKSVSYIDAMRGLSSHSELSANIWGGNQFIESTQSLTTADATPDTMVIADTDNLYFSIPTDMVCNFEIMIVASINAGADVTIGDSYAYTIVGLAKNLAGTSALVGAVDTVLTIQKDVGFDGSAVVSVCNTANAIVITCVGEAGVTIIWTAYIKMTTVGIRNFTLK